MSAKTGEGVDEVVDYIMNNTTPAIHKEIGYGSEAFMATESTMSDVVDEALDAVAQKHNLKIKTFFLEAFGMMEEGKGNTGRASKY